MTCDNFQTKSNFGDHLEEILNEGYTTGLQFTTQEGFMGSVFQTVGQQQSSYDAFFIFPFSPNLAREAYFPTFQNDCLQ